MSFVKSKITSARSTMRPLHNSWASAGFKPEFLRDISKIFPLRLCVSVLALPLRYPFIGVLDPRLSQRAIAEAKQIPETRETQREKQASRGARLGVMQRSQR